MIPKGMILLTSAVLAVSIIRLTRQKVLLQEMYCIETLARVDVLCLDKTEMCIRDSHSQHGYAHNYEEQQVKEYKYSAAVLTCNIRKSPYIADTDCTACADKDVYKRQMLYYLIKNLYTVVKTIVLYLLTLNAKYLLMPTVILFKPIQRR